jgi:hypothetical protein
MICGVGAHRPLVADPGRQGKIIFPMQPSPRHTVVAVGSRNRIAGDDSAAGASDSDTARGADPYGDSLCDTNSRESSRNCGILVSKA